MAFILTKCKYSQICYVFPVTRVSIYVCISSKDDELALSWNIRLAVVWVGHVPRPRPLCAHIKLWVVYQGINLSRRCLAHDTTTLFLYSTIHFLTHQGVWLELRSPSCPTCLATVYRCPTMDNVMVRLKYSLWWSHVYSEEKVIYLHPYEALHIQYPGLIADLLIPVFSPQHYHPLRHDWTMVTEPLSNKLRVYERRECGETTRSWERVSGQGWLHWAMKLLHN